MFCKYGESEENAYSFLINNIKDENLRKRIDLNLKYYIKKANRYKWLNNFFSIIVVVLPAVATAVSCVQIKYQSIYKWLDMAIPIITALITIATGIANALKIADKKNVYRDCAENLKSALMNYAYKSNNMDDAIQSEYILFEECETIIQEGYKFIGKIEKGKNNEE